MKQLGSHIPQQISVLYIALSCQRIMVIWTKKLFAIGIEWKTQAFMKQLLSILKQFQIKSKSLSWVSNRVANLNRKFKKRENFWKSSQGYGFSSGHV